MLRFNSDSLTNSRNLPPFLSCNKQKKRARRKMHFYGSEENIMQNVTKALTIKKALSVRSFE